MLVRADRCSFYRKRPLEKTAQPACSLATGGVHRRIVDRRQSRPLSFGRRPTVFLHRLFNEAFFVFPSLPVSVFLGHPCCHGLGWSDVSSVPTNHDSESARSPFILVVGVCGFSETERPMGRSGLWL